MCFPNQLCLAVVRVNAFSDTHQIVYLGLELLDFLFLISYLLSQLFLHLLKLKAIVCFNLKLVNIRSGQSFIFIFLQFANSKQAWSIFILFLILPSTENLIFDF